MANAPPPPPEPTALAQPISSAAAAPPVAFAPAAAPAIPSSIMSPSEDLMPENLRQQFTELEQWAIANKKDAKGDTIAFWSLKIPAILASSCAGIVAYFDLTTASVISGSIASVCVLIDGVHPQGMLRNTHHRAFSDIRNLTANMMVKWRTRDPNQGVENTARRIILEAEKERQRIAVYIRNAETALNPKNEV